MSAIASSIFAHADRRRGLYRRLRWWWLRQRSQAMLRPRRDTATLR